MIRSYKRLTLAICLPLLWQTYAAGNVPVVFNVPPDVAPVTLADGEVLNLLPSGAIPVGFNSTAGSVVNVAGGTLDQFSTIRGALNIFSGGTGSSTFARGATVTLIDGSLGDQFALTDGGHLKVLGGHVQFFLNSVDSAVTVQGGQVDFAETLRQSELNLDSGTMFGFMNFTDHSTINMSGGLLGEMKIGGSSVFNQSGGALMTGVPFVIYADGSANLTVQSALLNGSPVPGLSPGSSTALDVTGMTGVLSGILKDGSPFQFELHPNLNFDPKTAIIVTNPALTIDRSPARSSVTVTLSQVPEPGVVTLLGASALAVVLMRRRQMSVPTSPV